LRGSPPVVRYAAVRLLTTNGLPLAFDNR